MNSNLDLTTGSITKKLVIFALPLFFTTLLQQLYNIIDMVVIGQFIGSAGIVALSNALPIIWLTNAIGYGLSIGGSVLVAQYKGSNDIKSQNETVGTLFVSVALIFGSIATIIIIILCRNIFNLMKIPAESFQYAYDYISVISLGYIFMFGYNAVCSVMRGFGNSKHPLYLVVLSTIINTILAIVFVGPCKMGVKGAALATVLSQMVAFVLSLIELKLLFFKKTKMPLFDVNWDQFFKLLKIGLPVAGQEAISNLSFLVITSMLNKFGIIIAAAAGIGVRIMSFLSTPYWSIGDAVCVMVGQNFGAKNLKRTKKVGMTGWKVNLITSFAITILLQIFAGPLISIFDSNPEVISKGTMYLRIFSIDCMFYATMCNFDMFATGVGHSILGFTNCFIDSVFIRIFLCWLLAFPLGYGFMGICAGQAISSVIPATIGFIYYRSGVWEKNFKDKSEE